jgi:hypothetical protein
MALADETKRVVSQFEFSDSDVNTHVQEFLKQMSKLIAPRSLNDERKSILDIEHVLTRLGR